MQFESANPSVIRSVKQRDLLNTWLRLYAREQKIPHIGEYQPSRLEEELPDMVSYSVDCTQQPPRLMIQIQGKNLVMPVYDECVKRALPVYSISDVDDLYGRLVAYERLLLPFSEGSDVTHVIASLKPISEEGGFEIRNLMRGNDALPTPKLHAVIDRDLFHRAPGRIAAGDVIEFN
jgi:hypothetical protein